MAIAFGVMGTKKLNFSEFSHRYDGEWQNDKRHGKGIVVYKRRDGTPQEKYEVHFLLVISSCHPLFSG